MPTLHVEDGTASTSSNNTYVSVADVDTYCENHGLTAWAEETTYDKQTAILRGMSYVESKRFSGQKSNNTNPLKWPRENAYDEDGLALDGDEIPNGIKYAVCRAAYEESQDSGCLQPNLERSSFTLREKVDVIDITYAEGFYQTKYQAVDNYLKTYITNKYKVIRT